MVQLVKEMCIIKKLFAQVIKPQNSCHKASVSTLVAILGCGNLGTHVPEKNTGLS